MNKIVQLCRVHQHGENFILALDDQGEVGVLLIQVDYSKHPNEFTARILPLIFQDLRIPTAIQTGA
jgi:hypothetical protein